MGEGQIDSSKIKISNYLLKRNVWKCTRKRTPIYFKCFIDVRIFVTSLDLQKRVFFRKFFTKNLPTESTELLTEYILVLFKWWFDENFRELYENGSCISLFIKRGPFCPFKKFGNSFTIFTYVNLKTCKMSDSFIIELSKENLLKLCATTNFQPSGFDMERSVFFVYFDYIDLKIKRKNLDKKWWFNSSW